MVSAIALTLLTAHATPPACGPNGNLVELEAHERTLSLEVGDGAAVLTVRERIRRDPGGAGHFATTYWLPNATAVGARVKADGLELEARLDDDDSAAERFGAFETALRAGVPAEEVKGGRARTAVLASLGESCCSADEERLSVELATSCGADNVVLETTFVLESEPAAGAWRFRVPRDLERDQPLQVKGATVRKVFVDGGVARVVARGEDHAMVEVVPEELATLRGRLSVERLEPTGPLAPPPHEEWGKVDGAEVVKPVDPVDTVRVELDVPRPLADPAPALRVVFVLDASVSAGVAGIAKARAAVEGVLDALPDDARYAVVAFARRPWLVVDPWTSPRERHFPEINAHNGSDLLGALALARRVARDTAPEETPRIVLLSDLMQRRADTEAAWSMALAGAGVLTHVVALPADVGEGESYTWARLVPDEEPRAEAVEGTGGIFVELGNGDEPDAALWPHLVAPTRIDDAALDLAGRELVEGAIASHGEMPTVLHQGQGVRLQSVLSAGPRGQGFLTGFLWAQPLALPLTEPAATRRVSLALTANGPVSDALEDDIVRAAARRVNAVSRVTSLVHVPEFRPPEPEGMGFGLSGCGCGCCGCCGGFGRSGRVISCGMGQASPIVGELEALQGKLAEEAAACGVPRAAVRVESEDKEVLDVVGLQGGACVLERVWRWDLQQLSEYAGLDLDRVFERHLELEVRAEVPPEEPSVEEALPEEAPPEEAAAETAR